MDETTRSLVSMACTFDILAKNYYKPNSPEQYLLRGTAHFFKDIVNQGSLALEHLPIMPTDQALSILIPLNLNPIENEDLSFGWSKAVEVDHDFRQDYTRHPKYMLRNYDVKIFSSPPLMNIPIVLAEITAESDFNGRITRLAWYKVTPQMIKFASIKTDPDNDWYRNPMRVLRKHWINFYDNETVLKIISEDNNPGNDNKN